MADEICIVSIEDRDRWDAEHREGGLPSQSWRYAWALSASGIEPKLAVVRSRGSRMVMPFFERDWRGSTDIATTQGLSGASISPSSTAPLSLWHEYATQQGWVAGYVQLATSVELGRSPSEDELVTSNAVFLLDLRAGALLEAASRIVRRKVRRASESGVALVDDASILAEDLKRLYPAAMRRLGAQPHYAFSAETLERWALDPSSIVLGARVGGSVEAVSVACVSGRQAEYHISGSTEQGRQLDAWLIWKAVTRLRERGVDVLNLGGGVRPGDGVYRFKERFNGMPKALQAVRQIYDHEKYDELCRIAGVAGAGRWFPAYRAPES
jgi:Acetyltransferase (GNAT) domain